MSEVSLCLTSYPACALVIQTMQPISLPEKYGGLGSYKSLGFNLFFEGWALVPSAFVPTCPGLLLPVVTGVLDILNKCHFTAKIM